MTNDKMLTDGFEITAPFMLVAFFIAALTCGWSLYRRLYDPAYKETTKEALFGLTALASGGALHFALSYLLRGLPTLLALPGFGALSTTLLVIRTGLIIVGIAVLVRAWTRRVCGERGWIFFAVMCLVGGFALRFLDKLV